MRVWIDEDLTPALVDVAHQLGLDATCSRDRERAQQELFRRVVSYIEDHARRGRASDAGELMINRVVEVGEDGRCAHFALPAPA